MSAEQKTRLIEALAKFLVEHQAAKGIMLQVEAGRTDGRPKFAGEWASLRDAAGTFGYPTVEEEIARLTKLLS